MKYLRARWRRLKPRGLIANVAKDQSKAPPNHAMFEVTIAKWYFPWILVKAMKRMGVPAYFWPYFLWKAYIGKARSHATTEHN